MCGWLSFLSSSVDSYLVGRNQTGITNYNTLVVSMVRCGTLDPCFNGAISLTVDYRTGRSLCLQHHIGVNAESWTTYYRSVTTVNSQQRFTVELTQ